MAYTLGIIGGGHMGGAVLTGAVTQKVLNPREVLLVDPSAERRYEFAALGCAVTDDVAEAAACEQILLAVKPQVFPVVAASLGHLPRPTVVVSIMAGLASATIAAALGPNARVVRVMPNTPCQVGQGASAISLGAAAEPGDDALARRLFESIGTCISVNESLMHAVTALSGSGPAYVYLLAEAMEQAGHQLGLANADARLLAERTLVGAAKLLEQSGQSAGELRQAVTSPNGTTAAALEVMFERELPQIIAEAMLAARDRSQELAQPD